MKKIVTLSALSLGILFLAGCGQQPVSQPAPVVQRSAPAATNMQTYTSATYGFEFQYPKGWSAGDDQINTTSWRKSFYSPETKASLDEFNKQDSGEAPAPVAEIIIGYSENFKEYLLQVSPTSYTSLGEYIKGNRAFSNISQIDFAGGKAWYLDETAFTTHQVIIAEHNEHIYSVSLREADSQQDALQKYSKTITSFKFTN